MKAAQCLCELWFDIIHDQNTRKGVLHGSVGGVHFSVRAMGGFWTTCTIIRAVFSCLLVITDYSTEEAAVLISSVLCVQLFIYLCSFSF